MRLLAVPWLVLLAACAPAANANGVIAGRLGFPGEETPPMRVYAIAEGGGAHRLVTTAAKQTTFSIADVPPGRYVVVAYPATADAGDAGAGGWSRFVECGMTVACKDHTLIPVVVTAGRTTSGVSVADWYADAGAFPPEPGRR